MVVQCSPGLPRRHPGIVWRCVLLGLFSVCLLISCDSGGDTGTPPPSPDPTDPRFVQQGITEVLSVYRSALLHEDIDRLQTLLHVEDDPLQDATLRQGEASTGPPAKCPELATHSAVQFRDDIAMLLHRFSVRAFDTRVIDMDLTPDAPSVVLQETLSLEDVEDVGAQDPTRRAQRTCVSHLTLRLTRQRLEEGSTITAFLITEVTREGPLFQVEMLGQARAGTLSRVQVTETTGTFPAREVRLSMAGGQETILQAADDVFHGAIVLSEQVPPEPLQVSIRGDNGEIVLQHAYRLRMPGDRVVQPIAGTEDRGFRTLVEGTDGTIWAGGFDAIYQIKPGAMTATRTYPLTVRVGDLVLNLRVEELVIDAQERLHFVVFSPRLAGVIVPLGELLCMTVNAFDADYPFTRRDPVSGATVPSVITRAIAASGGGLWLFGALFDSDSAVDSSGGVFRATADLTSENCVNGAIPIDYDSAISSVFRRQEPEATQLLTNTIPAFVESQNGALWFGTALGLTRWQDGQFTPIPFDPVLSIVPAQLSQEQLDTLESFIGSIAAAIFASQPIETVMIGDLPFLDFFDRALVKEDFIFSAVEDHQNRLWVGTLGGGIRRIEAIGDTFQDTLHITRAAVSGIDPDTQTRTQGQLVSNIIFALAVDPDGAVWAATDKGVSRIQELRDGTFIITTFSALDGLALPVRDVAVSEAGTVWLATDGGLFQLTLEHGDLQGTVHDLTDTPSAEHPVAQADVIVRDTPFRAVTDSEGHFDLTSLPFGTYVVQVLGDRAIGGPFTQAFRALKLDSPTQVLEPLVVVRREPRIPIDPAQGGRYRFPTVPGAEIVIEPQGIQFPPGTLPEIGLTLLPLTSLPPQADYALGAAAELQPDGITFTAPFRLTLPNQGQLPVTEGVVLLDCLQVQKFGLDYRLVGIGRVGQDGMTITGDSREGETLDGCTVVVFHGRA